MLKSLIKAEGVEKKVRDGKGELTILKNIDISIYEGDFTVLMGASGAGKSSLLYALSGMDTITSGHISYLERRLDQLNENEMAQIRSQEFGFIFQDTYLVSNLSVAENILVAGFQGKRGTERQIIDRANQLMKQMGLAEVKQQLPNRISGGEGQRAAIARGVMNQPKLLFADEPTGALNKRNSDEVLQLLTHLNQAGQSILMVTHDLKAALRGNRILYMDDGELVSELDLKPFQGDIFEERERKVNQWLLALGW